MRKIPNQQMENLIGFIKEEKEKGKAVVSIDGIDDLLDKMGIDNSMKNYMDINEFVNDVINHKKLDWEHLTGFVKNNQIHFFSYIKRIDDVKSEKGEFNVYEISSVNK